MELFSESRTQLTHQHPVSGDMKAHESPTWTLVLKQFWVIKILIPNNSDLWGFSPHHQAILQQQLGVQEFNIILTLSTWRQHLIPQG